MRLSRELRGSCWLKCARRRDSTPDSLYAKRQRYLAARRSFEKALNSCLAESAEFRSCWNVLKLYADYVLQKSADYWLIDWKAQIGKRKLESANWKAQVGKRKLESASWKAQIERANYRAPLFLKGATTLENCHYLRRVPLFDSCMSFLQGAINLLCLSHVFPLGGTASAKAEKSVKFLSLLMLIKLECISRYNVL